jgi:hypothetical protein
MVWGQEKYRQGSRGDKPPVHGLISGFLVLGHVLKSCCVRTPCCENIGTNLLLGRRLISAGRVLRAS